MINPPTVDKTYQANFKYFGLKCKFEHENFETCKSPSVGKLVGVVAGRWVCHSDRLATAGHGHGGHGNNAVMQPVPSAGHWDAKVSEVTMLEVPTPDLREVCSKKEAGEFIGGDCVIRCGDEKFSAVIAGWAPPFWLCHSADLHKLKRGHDGKPRDWLLIGGGIGGSTGHMFCLAEEIEADALVKDLKRRAVRHLALKEPGVVEIEGEEVIPVFDRESQTWQYAV